MLFTLGTGGPGFEVGFLFPLSKLWVPRPCVFCKGGNDAADAWPALYHVLLVQKISQRQQSGSRPSQTARRTGHPHSGFASKNQRMGHAL